jgi:hypothetical protein
VGERAVGKVIDISPCISHHRPETVGHFDLMALPVSAPVQVWFISF